MYWKKFKIGDSSREEIKKKYSKILGTNRMLAKDSLVQTSLSKIFRVEDIPKS